MHRTTTLLVAGLLLAVGSVGCSSDSTPTKTVTKAATPTVTATPKLSRDETMSLCSDAVADAAPGWEDWSVSPGKWADDPRTPAECLPLKDDKNPPQGNRDYMEAFREGLEAADDPRADQ